jgi:hypothetical protein
MVESGGYSISCGINFLVMPAWQVGKSGSDQPIGCPDFLNRYSSMLKLHLTSH